VQDRPKQRARAGWGSDWSAAKKHARNWQAGWWADESCPPSLRVRRPGRAAGRPILSGAPAGGWREVGACGGARWRELHTDRAGVVEVLRRAGYIQRHRWERIEKGTRKHGKAVVTDWRYPEDGGPVAGLPAIDAWKVARKLSACSAEWRVNLRQRADSTLTAVALPAACGLGHLCPVCAAGKASQRARALRSVLEHLHAEAPAGLALVTLTQQARKGESLSAAQGRLRAALDRLLKGRPGQRLRRLLAGWWVGLEVTRNAETGWWHAHAHMVARLHPEMSHATARPEVAALWVQASEGAAAAAGQPGAGWSPCAGGVVADDPTMAGGWWREIDPTAAQEVYQACKYPTPITELQPAEMAEFLAVAHGRRWHYGGGCLQRVSALAAELDENGGAWVGEEVAPARGDVDGDDGHARIDLGASVSSMAPREAPRLDDVAPGYGYPGSSVIFEDSAPEQAKASDLVDFRIPSSKKDGLTDVLAHFGGSMYELPDGAGWVAQLPRRWVGEEVVLNAEKLRLRRLDTEQN